MTERFTEAAILGGYDHSTPDIEVGGERPIQVYFASRRKRRRGAMMIVAAVASGGWLVWSHPSLDMSRPLDVGLIAVTWALFFWIAAVGIERLFEPLPTLAAMPEGLVLFPQQKPEDAIPWSDIRAIEPFQFGRGRFASRFLTIVVDDPRTISRHLPMHLKIAFRIDRWAAGGNRYFRPRSDFDRPLDEVIAELDAIRAAHSGA